ncbi:hypothetical protein Y032_0012g1810 [Ancylostoma ceylanicum]|nr:hypothetical protein Y032_0012g1810 [Ancylostoma ceylanicum]
MSLINSVITPAVMTPAFMATPTPAVRPKNPVVVFRRSTEWIFFEGFIPKVFICPNILVHRPKQPISPVPKRNNFGARSEDCSHQSTKISSAKAYQLWGQEFRSSHQSSTQLTPEQLIAAHTRAAYSSHQSNYTVRSQDHESIRFIPTPGKPSPENTWKQLSATSQRQS